MCARVPADLAPIPSGRDDGLSSTEHAVLRVRIRIFLSVSKHPVRRYPLFGVNIRLRVVATPVHVHGSSVWGNRY
jgi:hypothetical protein